jgi:Spy/CpxP family protein refolding chaperone
MPIVDSFREDVMQFRTQSNSLRLFVGAITLAIAGAFVSVSHAQGGPRAEGGPMAMHGGFGHGRMLERMLDSVNASADQRARIHDIMKAAAADVRQQHEASRGLRDQALTLFTQPTVDARAAEALRQQRLQQHVQSSRRWMQAMLDASAVLTPEQRTQLAERIKQRRAQAEQRHQRRAPDQPTR